MIAPAPYFKVSDRSYVARSSLVLDTSISYVIVYSFKFAVGVGPLGTVVVIFTDGLGISAQSSSDCDGTPPLTSATLSKPVPTSPAVRLQSALSSVTTSRSTVKVTTTWKTSSCPAPTCSSLDITKLDCPSKEPVKSVPSKPSPLT